MKFYKYYLNNLISLFNNLANAFNTINGDMSFIHALCDLKKGDEVTINYNVPLDRYINRKADLKDIWNFVCDCRMCQTDREDLLTPRRGEILSECNQLK